MEYGPAIRHFRPDGLTDLLGELQAMQSNPRAAAVRMLLERRPPDGDEPLEYAYFRRSLDVIDTPERFLTLLVVAPVVAGLGTAKRRKAARKLGLKKEAFLLTLAYHDWYPAAPPVRFMETAMTTEPAKSYLRVHEHNGVSWFNRERFGDFIFRMYAAAIVNVYSLSTARGTGRAAAEEKKLFRELAKWVDARYASGYRVDRFIENLTENRDSVR